ncbi:MAG: ribosome maturation factor RimP [Acidobacteriota bacterium]|nr:MAG: ribosome maturation factor RimP [Acidobacteriota bacterium]
MDEQARAMTEELARRACTLNGVEFYHIECPDSRSRRGGVLRVFIDRPEGGVTHEDCIRVSRQLSALLDVEDPFAGSYTLEVSSPGMERGLYTPKHFEANAGNPVRLRTYAPVEGRRRFDARLLRTENGHVVLDVEGCEVAISLSNIAKAHLRAAPFPPPLGRAGRKARSGNQRARRSKSSRRKKR